MAARSEGSYANVVRWFYVAIALAALGCGGNTASQSTTDACSAGPAAWDHTVAAGQGLALAIDPRTDDILLVTERASNNDTVVRMNQSGHGIWRKSRPGVQRVAFDGNGDAFVSGNFTGSLGWSDAALTTTASSAGFVARLDTDGAVIWAHKLEATGGGLTAKALASDADGNSVALFQYDFVFKEPNPPVVGGFLLVDFDPAGHELWRKEVWNQGSYVVGTDATFDPGGNVVVSAHVNQGSVDFGLGPVSAGDTMTSLVAEFAPDGAPLWSRTLETNTMALSVACDSAGNVNVAGDLRHDGVQFTSKPFLTEISAEGTVGATRSFDTGASNDGESVAEGACGGVFVVTNLGAIAKIVRISGTEQSISTISPSEWVGPAAVDRSGVLVFTGTRPPSAPQQAFVTRWRP